MTQPATRRVVLEPRAQAEVRQAFKFYQRRQPGLGHQFRDRVRETTRLIGEHPDAFPEVVPGVRWVLTKQFPYKVYFLPEFDPIPVIAILHAASHPDAWSGQVSDE